MTAQKQNGRTLLEFIDKRRAGISLADMVLIGEDNFPDTHDTLDVLYTLQKAGYISLSGNRTLDDLRGFIMLKEELYPKRQIAQLSPHMFIMLGHEAGILHEHFIEPKVSITLRGMFALFTNKEITVDPITVLHEQKLKKDFQSKIFDERNEDQYANFIEQFMKSNGQSCQDPNILASHMKLMMNDSAYKTAINAMLEAGRPIYFTDQGTPKTEVEIFRSIVLNPAKYCRARSLAAQASDIYVKKSAVKRQPKAPAPVIDV